MLRKSLLITAMPALLAGCGPGLPFSQHPDPNAAQVVVDAQPLVLDCQSRFRTWLGSTPVIWDGTAAPSITRTEETISIRLEAIPTGSNALDPLQFSCDYDNGQFNTAGPVS
jgi:hypothetical protein